MADDEQFSLCWNNFNSNLSAGFHESLCRGDLVDVTLAAEGQFVKAHRLVLSVCSPYFRKMFTQMPPNQHAFVFLKDVSHTALKDLIQFMYCGEVNVKQEALPAFISTAEALQIKGLTDSDPPQSQTPPEPSTPTPQIQQQIQTSPRVRQRTSTARSYKIETVEDSGDDAKQTTQIVIQTTAPTHPPQATITTQPQQQQQQPQQQQHHHQPQHITQQTLHTQTHQITNVSMPAATTTTVVTQKRPAHRTSLGSVPHIKRSKSTIDPLEASDATAATHQINVQTTVVADTKPQVQQQQQQQTHHHQQQQAQQHQQQTNEPEYIDLPMDLPTKSEPDYAEETGEVDQTEQDATYVEDESYGDMRYDESYFTENEDAAAASTGGGNVTAATTQNTSVTTATTSKAIVKQQPLSDSSYMDTSTDPANSDAQENKMKSFTDNNDDFRRPLNLPKILDGKFYNNIQSHPKTPGGIQATCTTCFGKISGTTKSTGNFLSHIKRRHKEILPSCQLYCSAKNLSCFNQTDLKFPGNFPMTLTNSNVPIMLAYPTSTPVTVTKEHKPQVSCVTTTAMVKSVAPTTTTNPNVIPAVSTYLRSDTSSSSQTTTTSNVVTINNPTNGVFKQSPPFHL